MYIKMQQNGKWYFHVKDTVGHTAISECTVIIPRHTTTLVHQEGERNINTII